MPWKPHIADRCAVAVDTQEAEGEGDLGDPRAASLNQEVDEEEAEGGQQGEQRPVFGAGETSRHGVTNTLGSNRKHFPGVL